MKDNQNKRITDTKYVADRSLDEASSETLKQTRAELLQSIEELLAVPTEVETVGDRSDCDWFS